MLLKNKIKQTNKKQTKKLKWIFFSVKLTVSGELNNEAITKLPTIEADQITQACKARSSLEPFGGKETQCQTVFK